MNRKMRNILGSALLLGAAVIVADRLPICAGRVYDFFQNSNKNSQASFVETNTVDEVEVEYAGSLNNMTPYERKNYYSGFEQVIIDLNSSNLSRHGTN